MLINRFLSKNVLFLLSFLFLLSSLQARSFSDDEPQISTQPVGSSFYRHLAFDFDFPMKKLIQYEDRGFSRSEIISLLMLSNMTGTELKEYGNRRLNNKIKLQDLVEEAGLEYNTFYKIVQSIKKNIEAKGDQNLPPPVYRSELNDPSDKTNKGKIK